MKNSKYYSSKSETSAKIADKLQATFLENKKYLDYMHKDEKYFQEKWKKEDFGSPKLNALREQACDLWETQKKLEDHVESAQGMAGRPNFILKRNKGIQDKYYEKIHALEKKRDENWINLEEEFKGEKCVAYIEKAISISSSSHKKILQEKIKHMDTLNSDLDREVKLKTRLPEHILAEDPMLKKMSNKDPTLGDYMDARKLALDQLIRESRQKKQDVIKDSKADIENPIDLAISLIDESGPDYTGGDD